MSGPNAYLRYIELQSTTCGNTVPDFSCTQAMKSHIEATKILDKVLDDELIEDLEDFFYDDDAEVNI